MDIYPANHPNFREKYPLVKTHNIWAMQMLSHKFKHSVYEYYLRKGYFSTTYAKLTTTAAQPQAAKEQ
jgi:hypothetical protein